MSQVTVLARGVVTVTDYRCTAGPADTPFVEAHTARTVSYVRRGGFAYHAYGRVHELVPGAIMIGCPGDEYLCSHDHHLHGDHCMSLRVSDALADELGIPAGFWQTAVGPPRPPCGWTRARPDP